MNLNLLWDSNLSAYWCGCSLGWFNYLTFLFAMIGLLYSIYWFYQFIRTGGRK